MTLNHTVSTQSNNWVVSLISHDPIDENICCMSILCFSESRTLSNICDRAFSWPLAISAKKLHRRSLTESWVSIWGCNQSIIIVLYSPFRHSVETNRHKEVAYLIILRGYLEKLIIIGYNMKYFQKVRFLKRAIQTTVDKFTVILVRKKLIDLVVSEKQFFTISCGQILGIL